jgi:hypothetical protein
VGQPEVSFFRSNYRRHTNFAHVVERQTIQGNPASGGMSTVRFERKGDMLGYVYFTNKNTGESPPQSSPISSTEIAKVELLIGGQVIDEQDSAFSQNIAAYLLTSTSGKMTNTQTNFYPLHFSFCENWQSALPLVALQYHDVELRITWATVSATSQIECWANYVYLDTNERQELANKPQNMLICQTQKAIASNSPVMELNFNHPVKFLCSDTNLIADPRQYDLKLQINGTDVSNSKRYDPHFNRVTFYNHCPFDATSGGLSGSGFLYPFCLETNKLQPTGTLNFSRLDSARLVTDESSGIAQNVYAVNYNILRIQNGMGGLMYAN